jgi:hypothetical protein
VTRSKDTSLDSLIIRCFLLECENNMHPFLLCLLLSSNEGNAKWIQAQTLTYGLYENGNLVGEKKKGGLVPKWPDRFFVF